jgi:hypothetical protein
VEKIMKFKLLAILVIIALIMIAFVYRNRFEISGNTVEYAGLFVSERVTGYDMKAEVTSPDNSTLGMAAEEHLNFGRIPSGSKVRKTIFLVNDEQTLVKIRIMSEGDISPHISVSKNNFLLSNTSEITVTFDSENTGNFTGTLNVLAIKPKNWLAGWFLQWM